MGREAVTSETIAYNVVAHKDFKVTKENGLQGKLSFHSEISKKI